MALKFPEDRTGPALFQAYLTKRGITADSVEACGLEVISKAEAQERTGYKNINYPHFLYIPYEEGYAVIRGLGDISNTFAAAVLKKVPKIFYPKGDVKIYTPPLISWDKDKFSGTLILAESAIKAISLSQHGYAAIAGSGVSGIYTNAGFSSGWPSTLIDEGGVSRIVILFDADWQTNAQVEAAISALAAGINRLHPDVPVFHKRLELTEEGENQGIDDVIGRLGAEWLHEWLANDEGLVDIKIDQLLKNELELNEEYVITKLPSMIMNRKNRTRVTRADFTEVLEAYRTFKEKIPAGQGVRWVEIQPAREWLKWKGSNRVARQVYRPGGGELDLVESYYNTWYDDGVASVLDGDVAPFLKVYKNAIPDDVERQLLLESMAWMMQNRGVRLEKCFALIGADQGTGKSLLIETFGELMGPSNYASISTHHFGNHFNAALAGKEVILMDDITGLKTQSKGMFKSFVTDKTYMVEKKGKDAYKAETTAVLFITSNEFASLPLDVEDRRVHVCAFEPTVHYPQGHAWWDEYIAWLKGGGYGRLRGWFEGLDLSGYDPNFMPPMSATKIHMSQSGKTDTERWVDSLWNDMNTELLGNKRSYFTIDELAMLYHGVAWGGLDEYAKNSTIRALGAHLTKRFQRVGTSGIRTANGRSRYWGIRSSGGTAKLADVVRDIKDYPNLTPV